MNNDNKRISSIESCIETIDEKTDDLLEIADELERHRVNVKLDNGRYLNPVSAIRAKVDVIWDEVRIIAREAYEAVKENEVRAD